MLSGEPFIPETIKVHLGAPDADADNVTVPFISYLKNVASSEIYPTWPENALRANIYAITTFALNRIYTEWYRSRGYPFDITSVTQYDQAFVYGRETFENIGFLVEELFPYYIRRQGSVEPLFSAFCDGRAAQCSGLTQWGTVALAQEGMMPYEILQQFYGNDIDIVRAAEIRSSAPSFPGVTLKQGMTDNDVQTVQIQLNRISRNFPGIPKIAEPDGVFDGTTAEAVQVFQEVFDLPVTGEVDEAAWYQISYIYVSVKKLAELSSEGLRFDEVQRRFPMRLAPGDYGDSVRAFQYYLAVVGAYYERVPRISVTGEYDDATTEAVQAFQRVFGLPQTGIADRRTWNDLYAAYSGILESVPPSECTRLYPNEVLREGVTGENVRVLQQYLTYLSQYDSALRPVADTGYFGPLTRAAVQAFQREYGLTANGSVGPVTWDAITGVYSEIRCGSGKLPYQSPGYTIR